jgi:hypothetical protein
MEAACDGILPTDSQHYTGGQVLDARKAAALVGTHTTGPKKKRFKGSSEYLTHKKGCLLAYAIGKRRPVAPCAALEDLASFLGTR